ncbi:MAG: DUF2231 domain-containing protein [Nitrospinaceae bacterium]|nr:DUF2231 domain-containing protein [Nitrospinaceae bacterium]NIR56114.1 DUF2231 domain-containing protein [Nitrospinaceae bacterium]NIS86562.1 DUF2231 domain-containing protein [Nitrospinaceae bacterium]NIT83396.1 DUF2231 domain-containing protein [Nitrospinaceae bacterium]NIU45606.1 DUF2231 domain-containing protein [Nitrospinaceae bacterium]
MFFAELHPVLVPFPVALLLSGVMFEFYGWLQKEESARLAGGFNLRLGLALAAVSMVVGFLGVYGMSDLLSEADPRIDPGIKVRLKEFLTWHVLFACSTVLIFALALIAYRYRQKPAAYTLFYLLLAAGAVTTLAAGYCGGELVHRFGLPGP